jgi:threonine aldolase
MKRGFASDNNSGIHPAVLAAIAKANVGHVLAYGDDEYTKSVISRLQKLFPKPTAISFVFNGTGANVVGLTSFLKSHEAIICSSMAHIHVDECGAPEKFTGSKLLTIPTVDGKISPEMIEPLYVGIGNQHHVQPKVISISQVSELGTVYTPKEIAALADYAHARGMYLHVDGARIANAVVSSGASLEEMLCDTGVDVLSFGGTKNGMMCGEAVVSFRPELCEDSPFIRKQSMQLASKMRFVACQFEALLDGDLWLKNARHSNEMARLLADKVAEIPGIEIVQKTQANGIFVRLPRQMIPKLQQEFFFWVWDDRNCIVRWMTSFDTTESDVHDFVQAIRRLMN